MDLIELFLCNHRGWKRTSTNSEIIWPIKARFTATTSARRENCQRALPQIEMSGPFSSFERMHKHKSTFCPAPAFCLFKPPCTINRQKKRHTLQYSLPRCWPTMQLIHDLLQPLIPLLRYNRVHAKWRLKIKTKPRDTIQVTDTMQKLGGVKHIESGQDNARGRQGRGGDNTGCWLNTKGKDWCRFYWLHQYPFSLLIDWSWRWQRECVVPVDAGGCLSFSTILQ